MKPTIDEIRAALVAPKDDPHKAGMFYLTEYELRVYRHAEDWLTSLCDEVETLRAKLAAVEDLAVHLFHASDEDTRLWGPEYEQWHADVQWDIERLREILRHGTVSVRLRGTKRMAFSSVEGEVEPCDE